jgi:hypothetical protein
LKGLSTIGAFRGDYFRGGGTRGFTLVVRKVLTVVDPIGDKVM